MRKQVGKIHQASPYELSWPTRPYCCGGTSESQANLFRNAFASTHHRKRNGLALMLHLVAVGAGSGWVSPPTQRSNSIGRLVGPVRLTSGFQPSSPAGCGARGSSDRHPDMAARRRHSLTDDLFSDLIRAGDDGDRLTAAELRMLAGGLLLAGTDTTRNQVAASVQVLCEHPEQMRRPRRNCTTLYATAETNIVSVSTSNRLVCHGRCAGLVTTIRFKCSPALRPGWTTLTQCMAGGRQLSTN